MKNYIIVAAISAVVSIIVWEGMHVITGADSDSKSQKTNSEYIWRKHV